MANKRREFTYGWVDVAAVLGVTTQNAKLLAARGRFDVRSLPSIAKIARARWLTDLAAGLGDER